MAEDLSKRGNQQELIEPGENLYGRDPNNENGLKLGSGAYVQASTPPSVKPYWVSQWG